MKPTIVLVTGNKGKLAEVEEFLSEDKVTLRAIPLDLPEYQAKTVEEVSHLKSIEAHRQVMAKLASLSEEEKQSPLYGPLLASLKETGKLYVLVDDTSLEFACLNQLPGPYIKWFLDSVGPEGLVKMTEGFNENGNTPLAHNAEGFTPAPHRVANAACVLSLCVLEGESYTVRQFRGECEGVLVNTPQGGKGFGWDCIFAPKAQPVDSYPPYSRTYAELTIAEKRAVSHRGVALTKLSDALATLTP
ncbi:nucleoside-triphosphate pyrophosphatase [Angomonas deanei]|nr:nucleoside-triphosphate pyrophosphatase [Angomonas deanei]|eukprot:EPY43785.1 nucleoside-triphosphate pyrophosphatase [Angomonas deanei]